MSEVFIAYASGNDFHSTIIEESAQVATTPQRKITPWSSKDASGSPLESSVEKWIEDCDVFIADISLVNMNVTYELGFALGLQKPVRIIRSDNSRIEPLQSVGLLDNIIRDEYDFQPKLRAILSKEDKPSSWTPYKKDRIQPVFVLQPPTNNDVSRKSLSALKKIARIKFKNFNPAEISRLTAEELYERVTSSFGTIAFWIDDHSEDAIRNNQRAVFLYGLSRAMKIPSLLLAYESSKLPSDLRNVATRWSHLDQVDQIIEEFRNDVSDEIVQYVDPELTSTRSVLSAIDLGDPIAENEQAVLARYFVETDPYRSALEGHAHVLVGRKGSGKSAIFFRVRFRTY